MPAPYLRLLAEWLSGEPLPRDFNGPAFPCRTPTQARPRSAEKLAVMAARYRRRQDLFHPDDFDDRLAIVTEVVVVLNRLGRVANVGRKYKGRE